MHMLLLIGVSIGFALSVLTHNNFYSEKTFTSSANQWMCNEMKGEKSEGCKNLIAQASNNLPWNGGQWYNGGGVSSGQRSRDLVDIGGQWYNGGGVSSGQRSRDLVDIGGQWYNGGGVSSGQRSRDLVDIVESFFDRIFNAISNFFRWPL